MTHEPNTAVSAPYTVAEGVVEAREIARMLLSGRHELPVDPKATYRTRDVRLFEMAAAIILAQADASPLADLIGALEKIASMKMDREMFMAQGPAFACFHLESAVLVAEAALAKAKGETL